jgi:hypothetical protein
MISISNKESTTLLTVAAVEGMYFNMMPKLHEIRSGQHSASEVRGTECMAGFLIIVNGAAVTWFLKDSLPLVLSVAIVTVMALFYEWCFAQVPT